MLTLHLKIKWSNNLKENVIFSENNLIKCVLYENEGVCQKFQILMTMVSLWKILVCEVQVLLNTIMITKSQLWVHASHALNYTCRI